MDNVHASYRPEESNQKRETANLKAHYEREIHTLKLEHKIEILEKEKEIQSLQHEVEIMKLKTQHQNVVKGSAISICARILPFISATDRLVWGVEKYFQGKELKWNLHESYEDWYERISKEMFHKYRYATKQFIFKRQDVEYCSKVLRFVSRTSENVEQFDRNYFSVKSPCPDELWASANFVLLHPKNVEKSLELKREKPNNDYKLWSVLNVTSDYYWGDKKSAIIFGVL